MSPVAGFVESGYMPRASMAELRVRERHPCGLQTSCQPIAARGDKDCQWPADVRDISSRGVGLVLRRRFERGTGLALEIPGSDGQVTDTLLAKVVHVTTQSDGTWVLGCHFVSELSDDEVQRLLALAQAQRAEAEEADIFSERPGGETLDELAQASASMVVPGVRLEGPGQQGCKVGRAVRRFFLNGTWPVRAGTVLRLRIFKEGDEWGSVTVRVTRCVEAGKGWTIRYCFVGTPSPEALPLLGY